MSLPGYWGKKKWIKYKCFEKNLKKIANFKKKTFQSRKVKLLETIPLELKIMPYFFIGTWYMFSRTWEWTNVKNLQKF